MIFRKLEKKERNFETETRKSTVIFETQIVKTPIYLEAYPKLPLQEYGAKIQENLRSNWNIPSSIPNEPCLKQPTMKILPTYYFLIRPTGRGTGLLSFHPFSGSSFADNFFKQTIHQVINVLLVTYSFMIKWTQISCMKASLTDDWMSYCIKLTTLWWFKSLSLQET